MKNRTILASKDQEKFKTDVPPILHWDGKLLPSVTDGKEKADRVAVVMSGGGIENVLGVPKGCNREWCWTKSSLHGRSRELESQRSDPRPMLWYNRIQYRSANWSMCEHKGYSWPRIELDSLQTSYSGSYLVQHIYGPSPDVPCLRDFKATGFSGPWPVSAIDKRWDSFKRVHQIPERAQPWSPPYPPGSLDGRISSERELQGAAWAQCCRSWWKTEEGNLPSARSFPNRCLRRSPASKYTYFKDSFNSPMSKMTLFAALMYVRLWNEASPCSTQRPEVYDFWNEVGQILCLSLFDDWVEKAEKGGGGGVPRRETSHKQESV